MIQTKCFENVFFVYGHMNRIVRHATFSSKVDLQALDVNVKTS